MIQWQQQDPHAKLPAPLLLQRSSLLDFCKARDSAHPDNIIHQERGLLRTRGGAYCQSERERPCFFSLKVRWGVCYKTIIHFVEMKNPNRIINYCFQWEKKKKAFWDRWDWLLFNSQSKESLLAREWKKAWKRKDTGINLLIITVSFYCLVTATIGCCVTRRMKYVA